MRKFRVNVKFMRSLRRQAGTRPFSVQKAYATYMICCWTKLLEHTEKEAKSMEINVRQNLVDGVTEGWLIRVGRGVYECLPREPKPL